MLRFCRDRGDCLREEFAARWRCWRLLKALEESWRLKRQGPRTRRILSKDHSEIGLSLHLVSPPGLTTLSFLVVDISEP